MPCEKGLLGFVLSVSLVASAAAPSAGPGSCQYTFSTPQKASILLGYAKGYHPQRQPFANTLPAAQAWCCGKGPSVCGGITHQAGLFDARAGCAPRGCSKGCENVTSWVLVDPSHPCPPGRWPPPPGGGPPPVSIPVWPVPKSVRLATHPAGAASAVSARFAVKVPTGSPQALVAAALRYQKIIASGGSSHSSKAGLTSVMVTVQSLSTTLNFETNYSYSLQLPAGQPATVHAGTVFGAMYGLETLAQLVANGTLAGRLVGATIDDDAAYRYRGLMIDTGRRFVPPADIMNSLDAMSASKSSSPVLALLYVLI